MSQNKQSLGKGDTSALAQSSLESLIQARRGKAAAVRTRGHNPFANDLDVARRVFVSELRSRFRQALLPRGDNEALRYDAAKVEQLAAATASAADASVLVCGRLMARRGFGKVSFLELRDDTGALQIFVKADETSAERGPMDALEDIDLADHIAVSGPVIVTKTGELSVLAERITLLTKAYRPLAEKWHGLTDVEQRYRHRYVDTVANPDVALVFRARSLIIQGLRAFLDERGFLEVETPTLHSVIGGAAAHPFTTHHNTLDIDLFLRIAPELYLKRLLVGGFERVYEIGRCYRNEGISTRHNPEFTMLEFYEAYATYRTLQPLAEELFRYVERYLADGMARLGHTEHYQTWVAQRAFTLSEPFARVPMREGIVRSLEKAGLDAADVLANLESIAVKATVPADEGTAERVKAWARTSPRSKKIDWGNLRKGLGACASFGERLFVAYEYLVEPFLAEDYRSQDGSKSVPVFILDYPAAVSPLARRRDDDPELVERFELFVDGIERCNAFSELNDPDDQAERFLAQVEKKKQGAEETMDYDEDYIRALEHGMPPAAGFGLGVDRLVMMLTGQPSIREVIAFPQLRASGGRA
ncbi:MAG TPA: lysine--tRNA ligase [Polyangiaceae bacterium]|nr:lysine--tRNA ligase [Polyangiaceae bacterium]